MLEYRQGNIFEDNSEALVNTVNCVGVMGKGIALQCKNLYPDNFKAYRKACDAGTVVPGKMFVFETSSFDFPRYIINFPTKRHWRQNSFIEDIETGLGDFTEVLAKYNISSVAIPPLGCGNGGLDWGEVKPLIEKASAKMPTVSFNVYSPTANTVSRHLSQDKSPTMTVGRATLISLMKRYLDGLLDPMISLLEVHKLMYFMQESGFDLKLIFEKYYYGPYATNLHHVLNRIEGYFVNGFDGNDSPKTLLTIVPDAIPSAVNILEQHPDIDRLMQKVFELIDGFETSDGLELLSTVHWTMAKEKITNVPDIISHVHSWNPRKQRFSDNQIRLTCDWLLKRGWV